MTYDSLLGEFGVSIDSPHTEGGTDTSNSPNNYREGSQTMVSAIPDTGHLHDEKKGRVASRKLKPNDLPFIAW